MYKPQMYPFPGDRLLRFVGDRARFTLRNDNGAPVADGCRGFLRTNLGRGARVRDEVILSYNSKLPVAGAAWRDIPMRQGQGQWWIELPLVEVGFFQAKAYLIDANGRQFWPDGPDVGIAIHPSRYRTGNTIYCAFVRLFGESKTAGLNNPPLSPQQFTSLDKEGYAVIPPSGKLRDLMAQLDHIVTVLGCRILHLLPINPTPTTYARFGRFGSPYASQDLLAVDPALVEFDRRTTGIDQFRELTYAAHLRGARVFLDIVTNHTGWGSTLQENHPEWFLREADGRFVSPGAWGTTWEDLVELNHKNPASWEHLAEVFLTWCRRGVDGFRCDAGYKVPMAAWRYITACVRQEYPETVFLLEGLGGSWEATETLLTEGGMQWAYSELFQNYSPSEIASYLEYAHRQSQRLGLYVHYSETHDNDRLAKKGKLWSLHRNQLSGLTSVSGGYGFTCGVEWLGSQKINVHSSTSLNWGESDHLLQELGHLNRLLSNHPCFFEHARLERLSPPDSAVFAMRRDSDEGRDHVLVLANTDLKSSQQFRLPLPVFVDLGRPEVDLLNSRIAPTISSEPGHVCFNLAPGACHCLAAIATPAGLAGDAYRNARGCVSFALEALAQVVPVEEIGEFDWRLLAERVEQDPVAFLAALRKIDWARRNGDLVPALDAAISQGAFPEVVIWQLLDAQRITPVPPLHWLLVRDDSPFRASLLFDDRTRASHVESIRVRDGYVALFAPRSAPCASRLLLERYGPGQAHLQADVRFLSSHPDLRPIHLIEPPKAPPGFGTLRVLLTNGRGGMAHLCPDLGQVTSKYDCLLAANLHPAVPVDRHVLAKRCRAWLVADRFITPLDQSALVLLDPGPPVIWHFVGNAGDGRTVEIHLAVDLLENRNTTVLRFSRPAQSKFPQTALPDECDVRLTVRIDLEDRNFHWETQRNGAAEHHFSSHTRALSDRAGFEFAPAPDRRVRVYADKGAYHPAVEWSEHIWHPLEQSRGQTHRGDAFSPGWFDLPLSQRDEATIVLCADPADPAQSELSGFQDARLRDNQRRLHLAGLPENDSFGRRLTLAAHQFVVTRGEGKTVVAGYPWFLDWGRDTLICCRGLLAAGLIQDVRRILVTFARFEQNGTLPNSIHGEDASNRDTSDAPLWFGIACEEAAQLSAEPIYDVVVDAHGRTMLDILRSIAKAYLQGTPNGIWVDDESGLVWSPAHFTWMDTNYPAGTPRQGYPVEIQVLWIRLLQHLARVDTGNSGHWRALADRSQSAFFRYFWLEEPGYLADCLLASPGQPASAATVDSALRSNYLFALSLGLMPPEPAQRSIQAAMKYLVIPGALRSLAPLPVAVPLPIYGSDGRLLNDPHSPYWGQYQGDEDSQRKPAYHNGTAWTWTFPSFCEALVKAWEFQRPAIAAARAYLSSMDGLLKVGCLGQIPEILDGNAPHAQRGCDAQAWGVTEALRVWKWLQSLS